MSLEIEINRCLNEASAFLDASLKNVQICVNGKKTNIWGFPHYKSKQRITEYGGTSSGISAFHHVGIPSSEIEEKLHSSIKWLIEQQAPSGAWNASSVYCCEVTSGVLIDLTRWDVLGDSAELKADKYIKSCYNSNGFFNSIPESTGTPHLYTTYIAVKALNEKQPLSQKMKDEIKNWVISSKASDGNWGGEPQCNIGTPVYTAMALLLLHYCDYDVKKMKKDFKSQLRYVKKHIKGCGNLYESEEILVENGNDLYGIKYQVLHTTLYGGPIILELFIALCEYQPMVNSISSILKNQYAGGWGPTKERLTMWATQQAVSSIKKFQLEVWPHLNFFQKSVIYKIPFFPIKVFFSLLFLGLAIYLFLTPEFRSSTIVSAFFAVLPWFKERCYE